MSNKKKYCYDCNKEMSGRGITVGRISCPTVWCSICMDCFDKQPMTRKEKIEALKHQMTMNELVDNYKLV